MGDDEMGDDEMGDEHKPHQMDRRQFWTSASALALLAASGGPASWAAADQEAAPRLRELRLLTAAPLAEMKAFYQGLLGLEILGEQPGQLTIGGGSTRLTFVNVGDEHGKPFYHFAFNIPENKILAARAWQKERTPLILADEELRDSRYPDDVIDYSHWNAHSIFFWDPGGNLVEYIARHDLENAASGPFGTQDILYASEIAFIVDDVRTTASALEESFSLEQYREGNEFFTAIGDEHGLLLVMKRGRMLGFGEAKPAACFPTIVRIRSDQAAHHAISDFPYEISAGT